MTVPATTVRRPPPGTPRPSDLVARRLALWIAVLGGIVGGWPLIVTLEAPQPFQPVPTIAHVFGMLAGYGIVVMIGLMSRAPLLETAVGSDRLARWHGRGGRAVVAAIVVHGWAAVVAWMDSRHESVAMTLWHVERLPWLIAATLGTVLLLLVGGLSIRMVRRRVPYETWHTVHLLAYLGAALGFVHQLGGPDLAGHRPLQVLWALMYTLVFALVVVHRVLTPLRNATRHRMRVAAVCPEGPGVVSIEIDGHALDELQARAGQFFRWRFLTPDLWRTAHPFSLSAAPTADRLRLTVKSLGDGSGFLQRLEVGTWVLAEGPYGAMTAERRTRPDVLLVAGGVGITPMRALFQTIPVAPGQDLLLLYRARSEADLLFQAEIDRIAAERGARVVYLVGPQAPRFTAAMLSWHVPNLAQRDVYLCGPAGMTVAVRTALRQAGLPPRQLHEERFDL